MPTRTPSPHPAAPESEHLIEGLLDRVDALTDQVVEDIFLSESVYLTAPLPEEVLRELVHANLERMFLTMMGRPDSLEPARRIGTVKARVGIPLVGILHAYRLAGMRVWRALVELAGGPDSSLALLPLSAAVWERVDLYSMAASESYRIEQESHERLEEQSRRGMLIALLDGSDTAAEREMVRRAFHLPERAVFHVVVADAPADGHPEHALPTAWREQGRAAVWVQTVDESIGLVAGIDQEAVGLTLAQIERAATARLGISRSFSELGGAPVGVEQARAAMRSVPVGTIGVSRSGQAPLDELLASYEDGTARLVDEVLSGLRVLDPRDERALLDTLEAWFEAGGSVTAVAERLHCHRNTITNRLARVAELTGRTVTDPRHVAEIYAALRLQRLHGLSIR